MTRKPLSLLVHLAQTPWCIAGVVLLLGSLLSWQIALLNVRQQRQEKISLTVSELASVRARLEGVVFNVLSATSGIAGVIAHGGDIPQDLFAALSKQAIDAHRYIRNIGIAPDDVIAQIYPMKGNRQAIGLRYADNPAQYEDVRRARQTGQPIISGPHSLVQGGAGMIARVPVFTRAIAGSETFSRYWGNVSVVTDVEALLNEAQVSSTAAFAIELLKIAEDEDGIDTLLRGSQDGPVPHQVPVCMPVKIPGAQWQLCGVPTEGWPKFSALRSPLFVIGFVNTCFLSAFIGWLVGRPQRIQRHNRQLQQQIDERAKAEQELRLSEQKYASIFQLMPDMVGITRLTDGCFLEINAGFTLVSGWSAEEVIGQTSIKLGLWTPEVRKQAVALLQEHGRVENFPFLLRIKSGEQRHALMFLTRIRIDGEDCLYFMARDINELKVAQLHLEREQARLHNLLQTVPAMIWMKDPHGAYLSCNSRFEHFIGQPEAKLIGCTDYDFFDRELAEFFRSHDQNAIARGGPTVNEEWVTYADDNHRELLETIKTPIHDATGQLLGVLGVAWNITEKKQIEEALLQERTRFLNLVDSVDGIVWEADAQTLAFTYVSREAERLLGYPIGDWLEEGFWQEHLHPEDRLRAHAATVAATANGEDHELSYRFLGQDGRVVWIQDRISVVRENDQPRWRRGIMVDITGEKENESSRLNLENQLRQAQKIEAIGRLAGGVAHDFNNQLSVILGYADLMQQEPLAVEKRHSYTNQIIRAATQARDITRQLLAFSRQEVISPQVLDLNLLVKGIHKGLGRLIREDIRFEVRTAANLWPIYMDPTQVDQILMNLVVNARDAMAGPGQLIIETANSTLDGASLQQYPDLAPGDYVQLLVRDTGSGMSAETMLHIFEPFYTTKETGKGTGLGLATVYGIVRQNRGLVQVESMIGQGSTFTVWLPRGEHGLHGEQAASTSTLERPRQTRIILLVEDEANVRQMAQDILEESGFTVLAASTPAEALRISADPEQTIDLLLSDVIMPQMNGRELCTRIREQRPGLKTVFMSGYAGDILQEENDCQTPLVKKPFTIQSLLATIDEQFRMSDKVG